ncbi:MAG: SDR family NAD(P)-dependent oxidoreductase [Muribaculaceae bacterium]|nr:SDR family NAD(P)-dependent oxidoreductase [Muribaculaceae bacterium]
MKRIIIVGASSGIGRCVALEFINRGFRVGVAARRVDKLNELVNIAPTRVIAMSLDVTASNAIDILEQLISRLGGMDILFLASGVGNQNPELDFNIEKRTILTNVLGFTNIIDYTFKYFRDNNFSGHISVISSIAGTKGLGSAPSYSATKGYQNTYIEALEQLAVMQKLPITFTDIRPGFVATALLDDKHNYPLLLSPEKVAKKIVRAVLAKKHVAVIDWRYSILTFLWSLIPRFIWRRLPIRN